MTMKSVSRFVVIFLIFSAVFLYIITKFMNSSEARYSHEIVWTDVLNYKNRKEPIVVAELQSNKGSDMQNYDGEFESRLHTHKNSVQGSQIVLAVVACGDRLSETLVMIKSAILFTQKPLNFIVLADDPLIPSFKEKLNEWKDSTNHSFTFKVLPITFPLQGNTDEWKKLFKPCASQRLFLPTVLNDVDSLLYVDTDTLFLGPLEDVWRHFDLMNSSQIAALTPEHEDPNTGWYNRFAKHPYYGHLGVNSGVMLMNLTRMRAFSWTSYVVPIYKEYKLKITWGDQDIINIIFHFHPDKLYIYPCRYNYRPDHCMYMSVCKSAESQGVAVLHGSRGSFHAEKQPAFQAVYRAMEELGSDPYTNLFLTTRNYLEQTTSTNCGKIQHIFTQAMQHFIQKTYGR
ncbi:glucoside xylosyltransferase 2 isoform X2 [Zootermopsis nevadensis]|uniref:glucoside xylosyltransferase 2 isoform X2 n=1 Tax=Zootermopsis nevadensis TaxID=136037 RepID=UPI000B8E7502|nr:glucoside xylosyltransferase 2 isoform X2 [Zootermopsis nevadensis]